MRRWGDRRSGPSRGHRLSPVAGPMRKIGRFVTIPGYHDQACGKSVERPVENSELHAPVSIPGTGAVKARSVFSYSTARITQWSPNIAPRPSRAPPLRSVLLFVESEFIDLVNRGLNIQNESNSSRKEFSTGLSTPLSTGVPRSGLWKHPRWPRPPFAARVRSAWG